MADATHALVDARHDWPALRLTSRVEDVLDRDESVTDDRAELTLKTGGQLTVDRRSGTARYGLPRELSAEELVHPYLAPAAAVFGHWIGRLSFHAGGFVHDDGAWALVGDRGAGKSSLLAWLALRGHGVVTDDLLVVEQGSVYTGPRSIDLRAEAADRLGAGTALGMVGARERWRLPLSPLDGELPFRGWIFLGWGDAMESRRLAASECLPRLAANLTVRLPPTDPGYLLDLAGLPAWELRRPMDWLAMEAATDWLLSVPE